MPGVRVEAVTAQGAAAHERAWRDLGARALEPNVFAEPAFVLGALRHFRNTARLELLLVWQDQSADRLIGAIVLETPRAPPGFGVARAWRSEQAGLAALALDREAGGQALDAIIDWLARERPRIIGLLTPALDAAGPMAALLETFAARQHARRHRFGRRSRAILPAGRGFARGFEASLPGKRLKEWRRQLRRLGERGAIAFRVASGEDAVEAFLALEARGWKGVQGAALRLDAGLAAFTRSMLAGLAREGRLASHLMELDGTPIAAGVVLRSEDRAFYWKTAYDEAYAAYSPGVQLTLELSRVQQRDATVAATDSCAIEGHPMIERLWPARVRLIDCVIATRPGPARRIALWIVAERAKRLINPLRGRRVT